MKPLIISEQQKLVPEDLIKEMIWRESEFYESQTSIEYYEALDPQRFSIIISKIEKRRDKHMQELARIYSKINRCLPVQPAYQEFVDNAVDNMLIEEDA